MTTPPLRPVRRRWLRAALPLIALVAATGVWLYQDRKATAGAPDHAFFTMLQTFDTLYVGLSFPLGIVPGCDRPSKGCPHMLSIDARAGLFMLDGTRAAPSDRYFWDLAEPVVHLDSVNRDPEQLEGTDRLAEVWDEIRQGFPRGGWSEDDPRSVDPAFRVNASTRWYRWDAPFDWAQDIPLFFELHARDPLDLLQVRAWVAGRWLHVGVTGEEWNQELPLDMIPDRPRPLHPPLPKSWTALNPHPWDYSGCPGFKSFTATPTCIWPPNGKFVRYELDSTLTYQTLDHCVGTAEGLSTTFEVSSDEDLDDEDVVVGSDFVCLRADRDGSGDGRTYAITLEGSYQNGRTGETTLTVTVPHDQSSGCPKLANSEFVEDCTASP